MRTIIAWWVFAPGAYLILQSIITLRIDGLTLIGAGLLIVWAWLLGVFTSEFWAAEIPPSHPNTLSRLDRLDGVGTRTTNQEIEGRNG